MYQFMCFFFITRTVGILKFHACHYLGKYCPWYWISPYLLCQDMLVLILLIDNNICKTVQFRLFIYRHAGRLTERGTDRQKTDRQRHRLTYMQIYRQTEKNHRKTGRQTDRQTYRQTDNHIDRHTYIYTDRQTCIWTGRCTDRQTDR